MSAFAQEMNDDTFTRDDAKGWCTLWRPFRSCMGGIGGKNDLDWFPVRTIISYYDRIAYGE